MSIAKVRCARAVLGTTKTAGEMLMRIDEAGDDDAAPCVYPMNLKGEIQITGSNVRNAVEQKQD